VSASPPASAADALRRLAARATAVDGVPPFSDQALLDAVSGARRVIGDGTGAAVVAPAADGRPDEFELVVDPDARGAGVGTALLARVLGSVGRPVLAWAHGDSPAARALAARADFAPVRTLLQLRAAVPDERGRRGEHGERGGGDPTLDAFRIGADEEAWVALNARAFAEHPEQGSLTVDDLRAREAEPWFDPAAFLLLRAASGDLVGFCWLKIEGDGADAVGEFYAVGVDPAMQGRRLGGVLVDAGLRLLAERGIDTASLYVEGDNRAALALYTSRGFAEHARDVQYRSG